MPGHLHVLQHATFEPPGHIADWALSRKLTVKRTLVPEASTFPKVDDIAALVVMGGPMSVNDHDAHPWLVDERVFIQQALKARTPTIGICLGAQLLASIFGAKVVPAEHPEVGWFPVDIDPDARAHPAMRDLPDRLIAMHWHGEAFALPNGATRLASSPACQNQAFAIGDDVLGLQFHLELDPGHIEQLAKHCPEDLEPGPFVQPVEGMLEDPSRFEQAHRMLDRILDNWLGPKLAQS